MWSLPRLAQWGRGLALGLGLLAAATPGRGQEVLRIPFEAPSSEMLVVPDEFVVVFETATAHRLEALPPEADRARANLDGVQEVLDRVAARGFRREFASAKAQSPGSPYPDLTGHYLVKLQPGGDLEAAMTEFGRHRDVDHVEKIGVHPVDATPNDRYYMNLNPPEGFPYKQWHYWDTYGIDADLAWDAETGYLGVAVGILDTGMRYYHSDLGGANPPGPSDADTDGNVWVNLFEIPSSGLDDDGNGFVDDVIGYDFVSEVLSGTECRDPDCATPDNDPFDGDGHGTHVAGTVGAITNNDNRVAGVAGGFANGTISSAANGCKVIPLRIGYHCRIVSSGRITGIVSMAWAAQAMDYVADLVDRGINVTAINCSWGSSDTGGISAAVAALQARDVLIVTAAGNANGIVTSYLSTVPGVLTVGATDSLGVGWSSSNFGPDVDLAAPGVDIVSTYSPDQDDGIPDGDYTAVMDGTSMSAPHVAGTAALLASYNPTLTAAQKADLIVNNTSPFGPGNTKQLGTGILNARQALMAAPLAVGVKAPQAAPTRALRLRTTPNPAHSGADLMVYAPAGEEVSVAIVDVSGRVIRSFETVMPPVGWQHLHWDGIDGRSRRPASGVYLVVARTVKEKVSTKLIVLE